MTKALLDTLGNGPRWRSEGIEGGWRVFVRSTIMLDGKQFDENCVDLNDHQYRRYRAYLNDTTGRLAIQDCLPELTRDEREVLLSGLNRQQFLEMWAVMPDRVDHLMWETRNEEGEEEEDVEG
jgi:hypothetical protein